MASLSELVEIIARVEGMEPATVGLIARNVRETGLISEKGRGRSAAKMTLTDAANLLIAVNATVTVRESAQTLQIYRQLETVTTGFVGNDQRMVGERVQLGRALEYLIEAASNGIFERFFSTTVPSLISTDFRKEQVDIELVFYKPQPYAQLIIYARSGYVVGSRRIDVEAFKRATRIAFDFELPHQIKRGRRKYNGDRKDATTIGFPTIRAVAKLLQG